MVEQLVNFNKILDDLENLKVELEDEDKALLLHVALVKKFEYFKDVL